MTFLAIETSCDETAAAVFTDDLRVLSNVVASQTDLHARFGGVVPEIASRAHLRNLLPVIDEEDPGKNFDVRAYQMVRTSDGTTSYQPSAAVAQDAFASRLILAHMEREWRALRDRYEHFREFWLLVNRDAEVHTQVDAIEAYGTYIAS